MDLEGLSFKIVTHTTARKVVKEVVSVLQNHYPECSGRVIIINAPKVFSIAWSFIKPMLDAKTVSKISIFGSDQRQACTQLLLELVDADQLPSLYGGSCICDGKDPNSCMRAVKGPWGDPEVLSVIEEESPEKILTPEGCKLLMQRRGSMTPPSEEQRLPTVAEAKAETEAVPPAIPIAVRALSEPLQAELARSEAEVEKIESEYKALDEVLMTNLTDWVAEYNNLVHEIGWYVIERGQSYYDKRSLWQHAVQEFAWQREEVEQATKQFEVTVKSLNRAEAAFESYLEGKDLLTEEEWDQLAPAKAGDEEAEAQLQDADPKLRRALRVSRLADQVTILQRRRDAACAEMANKSQELEDAKRRFELEEARHSGCTWNCSVKRAAPFYEKRRLHEQKVDSQMRQLCVVEKRLVEARNQVAVIEGQSFQSPTGSLNRSRRQLDELSLQSFEIRGGQAAEDEFLSCDELSDDDR
eukprot:TRINITY_DN6895_c0_g2_i1.p1 TRINITY_DN6895_c0_g2~~TRINITY_DN6895_c0_g2_i1.p1  ORF type:complete len:470 (-),score=119.74 TRINITY_DN6895_c0_g2_i1:36-1445(-)